MTFVKNDSRINRSGRKAGVQNKTTNELRMLVQDFIEDNLHTLQKSFDKLEDKDKLNFIEKLLKHVLPTPLSELERLTDEQLDILIHRLKRQQHDTFTQKQA
jgi:polyhydroxyalkanoate synthesis regulator protein